MKEIDYINVIEKLNEDYNSKINDVLNSKSYRLGNKICLLFDIKNLFKNLKIRKMNRKINRISFSSHKKIYNKDIVDESKKCVVYSCVTGNYDNIKEPLIKLCDYVMFTDSLKINSNNWNIRILPDKLANKKGNLANRYIKFHPFEFFKDYDYAIYIDGNVQVISDPRQLCKIASNSKIGLAMHSHSSRNCLYNEALACKIMRRGNKKKIDQQILKYRKEGFPKKFGLCEATIIVYDLKNKNAQLISNAWYEEFLNSSSGRDQLALPYVIWKNNFKIEDIGFLGNNVWENPIFKIKNERKHKN